METLTQEIEDVVFLGKKKKKQQPKVEVAPVDEKQTDIQPTEPDYTYEFLLRRAYDQMTDTNTVKKLTLPVPHVGLIGTKKTCVVNFKSICSHLRRSEDHVKEYIAKELGTSVSQSGNNGQLIIKGRYRPLQIESIFRSYVNAYVMCSVCKSYLTNLVKENRIIYVQCLSCHSKHSINAKSN